MPLNFGNCVLARNSATPHLNPIKTLSEMKVMIEPALTSHQYPAEVPILPTVVLRFVRLSWASP
jgi:hypothetical protein